MYLDLFNNRLQVVLNGYQGDQNRLRLVQSQNPIWYSKIFNKYHNGKKPRRSNARIRRKACLKALLNLSEGIYRNSFIYNILIDELKSRIFEGYECEGYYIPAIADENFLDLVND